MSDYLMSKPKGTTHTIGSIHYKIGVHDFIFMYLNGRWTRSTLTLKSLNYEVKRAQANVKTKQSISGVKGVSFSVHKGLWTASTYINRKRKHLGQFKCMSMAIARVEKHNY